MLHILLADLTPASHVQATRWPVQSLARLKNKPVRVVFDDDRALRPVLRDLCACDADPIELLDIDKHRWGFVFYEQLRIRKTQPMLNRAPMPPEVMWMPGTSSALWLIERITTNVNETCASNLLILAT